MRADDHWFVIQDSFIILASPFGFTLVTLFSALLLIRLIVKQVAQRIFA